MSHAHAHHHPHGSRRRLALVLGMTCAFLGVEVVAGFLTGSLSLLADAGHMLTDVAGLVLASTMRFLTMSTPTWRAVWNPKVST